MASSPAFTALNLKPNHQSITHEFPFLRSTSTSTGKKRLIRVGAEMKIFKGTRMREQRLTEMIEQKVIEAKQVCSEDETSDECRVAWDEVEEVSQAKADLRLKIHQLHQDPLESFCQENPETDECRIYED